MPVSSGGAVPSSADYRFRDSVTIISENLTAPDSDGGFKKLPATTIVTSYACMLYPAGLYAQQQAILQYGLSSNASVSKCNGVYNASVAVGMFVVNGTVKYRILACSEVHGSSSSPIRLAMLLVRVEA